MHHDACVAAVDTNILIVSFVVNKFQLNIFLNREGLTKYLKINSLRK